MIAPRVLVFGLGITLGAGTSVLACADGDPGEVANDGGADVPFIDAGARETGSTAVPATDAAPVGEDSPVVVPDTTPPAGVVDLGATAETHAAVSLAWTAPANEADAGTVSAYELRFSTAPITTLAEFMAATVATPPSPLPSGSPQTATITGLLPATQYHFALRARDAAGNFAPLSNDAVVTTKARAAFLVSEIAPLNSAAQGGDFIELVAVQAGSAADLEVRHSSAGSASALLHKLAPLDVVVGDRIVVHVVGLPGPTGFAQEDASKNKASSTDPAASLDAYDVYSAVDNLLGTNSLVSVIDGATYQDVVPYSDRAGADASAAAMTAFANAHAAGAWTFSVAPVDGSDDCPTLVEVVNASASSSPACGVYPGFLAAGLSIQRNGVTDTNTRADFSVAEQTRGAANAPYCAPEGAALAITEVNPSANLLELTATQGGSLRGFSVRRDPRPGTLNGTLLGTMPAICAAAGDVIVVHLDAPGGSVSEVTSKDQLPASTNAGYYDGAWDVMQTSGTSALPYATSLVVAVRDPTTKYVEAAAFSSKTVTPTEGGTYHQALAYVQGLGLWLPADCGGAACTNTTTPTARDVATSWNGVGSLPTDASCRRSSPGSAREAASWTVGASNVGQ